MTRRVLGEYMRANRSVFLVLFLVFAAVTGCAASQRKSELQDKYGKEQVRDRVVASEKPGQVDYWSEVLPILENRCVVCHGCYDAPCQLKLGSPEGLDRGGNKEKVYVASRLLAANLTRLFEDANSTAEWRNKGFHTVLNERENSPEANREGSVLYQMLRLKNEHALPQQKILEGFDLSIDREQSCPTIEEFPEYAKKTPTGGMPYALPGISKQEFETIERWVEQGSVFPERPSLPTPEQEQIKSWESFLNRQDNKARLMSRYVYEHLFLGHLYFSDLGDEQNAPQFYNLVRSKTPPGKAVEDLATRRPFDDPGVDQFYYRFQPVRTTILDKSHLPYSLSEKRMKRYEQLFLDNSFEVKTLPGYDPRASANPFASFLQIPVNSRYRFLLDDAYFFIGGFIKGPVCRGQVALNVINDRFWITFLNPNHVGGAAEAELYAQEIPELDMPAGDESNAAVVLNWVKYSNKQKAYLKKKAEFENRRLGKVQKIDLDLIWNGDESNRSAALTVMRHEDSATVLRGFVGSPPKTSWVLGYGLLERIHYLLVAGFDVYGNVGHQLITRHYMDFLRMEAEMNFLGFLPRQDRAALRDEWYQGAEDEAREFINSPEANIKAETSIVYSSMNPELEFYEKLSAYLQPILDPEFSYSQLDTEIVQAFSGLAALVGGPVRHFPPLMFLELEQKGAQSEYFTIIRDDAHSNITSLFQEQSNRLPEKDMLTITRGLVGAYPNAFLRVRADGIKVFAQQVEEIKSAGDYTKLLDQFGVRRSSKSFWQFADALHGHQRKAASMRSGLFDFNRLQNR